MEQERQKFSTTWLREITWACRYSTLCFSTLDSQIVLLHKPKNIFLILGTHIMFPFFGGLVRLRKDIFKLPISPPPKKEYYHNQSTWIRFWCNNKPPPSVSALGHLGVPFLTHASCAFHVKEQGGRDSVSTLNLTEVPSPIRAAE